MKRATDLNDVDPPAAVPDRRNAAGGMAPALTDDEPMGPEIEVEISNTQGHLRVAPAILEELVRLVLTAEGRSAGSISIALVDDLTIHAVNQRHLGHDWPTDVISFPLGTPADPILTGELVVSAEMACASARELGVEPEHELALYIVHGLLHLCGFDDHDAADVRRMRDREAELLSRAGLITRAIGRAPVLTHEPEGR